MSVANLLQARAYWPFQGDDSFVGPCFIFVSFKSLCAVLTVHCSIVVACWEGLASRVWCFCVVLLLSHFYTSLNLKTR